MPRNGSMSASSWWRKFDSASSTPARKAPIAIDRPASSIPARRRARPAAPRRSSPRGRRSRRGAEERVEAVAAGETTAASAASAVAMPISMSRLAPSPRTPGRRQQRQQREQRHDREVLEQQDREGALAVGAWRSPRSSRICSAIAVADSASASPTTTALRSTSPSRPRRRQRPRRHADLRRAEPEDVAAHREQPRRLELEPDDEQQEHDAELGDVADGLGLADERQAGRADGDAGGEVAEHGAEAEAPEQRHGDHRRGAEDQDRRQEARMARQDLA